jgi:hypothetical protein
MQRKEGAMSPDNFTTTDDVSWGSRLLSSIKGVFVGLVLFLVAFPVLFWNEGRAVRRARGLAQGEAAVVAVLPDKVDSSNDGRLIHFTGRATTGDTLTDPQFGVSAIALRLLRSVEMYQWVEEKEATSEKQTGGGTKTTTTYKYSKQWRTELIPSNRFNQVEGHANPGSMAVAPQSWQASSVKVEAFSLPGRLVSALPAKDAVSVPASPPAPPTGGALSRANASGTGYYVGDDANNPQVGDLRIAFLAALPMDVSVLGQQVRDSVGPYLTQSGTEVLRIEPGVMAADVMFQHVATENAILTWALRGAGFFAMLIGIVLIFRPLVTVADVLPFLGGLLGAGVGVLAFGISVPLTLMTIGIAWVAYRPVAGIALLSAGVVLFVLLKSMSGKPSKTPVARAV